jgi:hypothetical protein
MQLILKYTDPLIMAFFILLSDGVYYGGGERDTKSLTSEAGSRITCLSFTSQTYLDFILRTPGHGDAEDRIGIPNLPSW